MQRATVIIGHQREFSHARGIEIMRTAKNAVWLLYVLCPFLTLSHPLSEKKEAPVLVPKSQAIIIRIFVKDKKETKRVKIRKRRDKEETTSA
jgi:hypothetical protein